MNIFKRIFGIMNAKATTLAVNQIKAVDNYNQASVILMDEIERLDREKNEGKKLLVEFQNKIKDLDKDADSREATVRKLLEAGNDVDKTVLQIILRKRQLAAGLHDKVKAIEEGNKKRAQSIVLLNDRLETLKHQLELERLNARFAEEGVDLPEVVDYNVEDVTISVNRLMQEVDVFTTSTSETPVTAIDVDAYLESLKGEVSTKASADAGH